MAEIKHDQPKGIDVEPRKVWQTYPKLTIVLNFINK